MKSSASGRPSPPAFLGADPWLSGVTGWNVFRLAAGGPQDEDGPDPGARLRAFLEAQEGRSFCYLKAPTTGLRALRFAERCGFQLVDTNVVFEGPAGAGAGPGAGPGAECRLARAEDEEEVAALAYHGFDADRWHADEHIGAALANRINAEWARNYFHGGRGDAMVLALHHGAVVGFAQLLRQKDGLVIDLIAVARECRRQGLAQAMIRHGERALPGVRRVRVGTQLANLPAVRLYEGLGLRLVESHYVYHHHVQPGAQGCRAL